MHVASTFLMSVPSVVWHVAVLCMLELACLLPCKAAGAVAFLLAVLASSVLHSLRLDIVDVTLPSWHAAATAGMPVMPSSFPQAVTEILHRLWSSLSCVSPVSPPHYG
jgi:hypothetical protein